MLIIKLVCRLPLRFLLFWGRRLGELGYFLIKNRRLIVVENLKLAFPEKSAQERKRLALENFRELGMGVSESIYAWYAPKEKLKKLGVIEGLDNIPQNNGAILMFGHFSTLEMGGTLLALNAPINAMYREQSSGLINKMMIAGRKRFVEYLVAKKDLRTLIKVLTGGKKIYYGADQHSTTGSWTYTNFFGCRVATTLATSKIADKTRAQVLFVTAYREKGRYRVVVHPQIEDIGENPVKDAQTIMSFIEREARANPAAYFWLHRRFKSPPEDSFSRLVE